MDIEIRPILEEELDGFFRASADASSSATSDDDLARERSMAEPDRCFAAFDGAQIVGTAGAYTMPMTVPGSQTEVGFVTAVGVLPTHRRRGINTELMRRQLEDARRRGETVSVLFASEGGIYGRFGYGLATFGLSFLVETARSAFVRGYEAAGEIRGVGRAEAVREILSINEANRPLRPGMVHLDRRSLEYDLGHEHGQDKTIPSFFVLHVGDEGTDGYAVYKVRESWPHGFSESVLSVRHLDATTPGAYADLWRFVLDVDLIEKVEAWNRPLDEPLLYLLRDPRRIRPTMIDNLWVRLVDVSGALAARRYPSDGRLGFEVADPFGPWNEGRYALEVSGGEAIVEVGADVPVDLACTVTDLGAAYLGGTTFRQLHRAGRVEELNEGALELADALFGWDPAPWSPYSF
ncbi:MAG TPA: GNAT family N-acetyltransferase [Actinomycetota bacterium]|nr:GNAT family N-acetyltransferase [Actinomycetota bacterium]